jgi:hypothetical protein
MVTNITQTRVFVLNYENLEFHINGIVFVFTPRYRESFYKTA